MIVPLWFTILWACASIAYAGIAGTLIRRRLVSRWPSLFVLSADYAIVFVLFQYHWPYHTYFWMFWINTGIRAVIRIWLAVDVARSLPGHKFIPCYVANWTVGLAALAGIFCGYLTLPHIAYPILTFILALNRSVTFTWAAMLFCSLLCIAVRGLGFSLTGMRIVTGLILKLLSEMATALIITTHLSSVVKTAANVADTAVAFGVAVYWCYSINDAPRAAAGFRENWANYRQLFTRPSEKES